MLTIRPKLLSHAMAFVISDEPTAMTSGTAAGDEFDASSDSFPAAATTVTPSGSSECSE